MKTTTRREFILSSCAVLVLPARLRGAAEAPCRFGMVADAHYAGYEPKGSRFYADSLGKLRECVDRMNGQAVDFLIALGDMNDGGRKPPEADALRHLRDMEAELARFRGRRYHVLGNHDMDALSKDQVLSRIENTGVPAGRSYYSFDCGGLHFIVLDPNFRDDGAPYDRGNYDWKDTRVPAEQMDWLLADLSAASRPAIVFTHQLLDGDGGHDVNNAADVRRALEASAKTLAVFQGHQHGGNLREIAGIHYYTLRAMVEGSGPENSAYAIAEVRSDRIVVRGHRRAVSADLGRAGGDRA